MKNRFLHIDFLRCIAILGVLIVHTFFYHLTNSINTAIWNFGEFVVGSFVFCSGYVLYYSLQKNPKIAEFLKKRFARILIPFYVYFFVHFLLTIFLPNFFSGLGVQKTWSYFFQSIFLFGGINTNWLPLLFLELAIISPFVFISTKVSKWISLIALLLTVVMTFIRFPYNSYRFTMWVGWSLILLLGGYVAKKEQYGTSQKRYIWFALFAGILYGTLFVLFKTFHRPFSFIDNKYPPNLFYLSYSIFGTFLVFLAGKYLTPIISQKLYVYISKKSYGLFFIHYLVLDFSQTFLKLSNVWVEVVFVVSMSIFLCLLWDKIKEIERIHMLLRLVQ